MSACGPKGEPREREPGRRPAIWMLGPEIFEWLLTLWPGRVSPRRSLAGQILSPNGSIRIIARSSGCKDDAQSDGAAPHASGLTGANAATFAASDRAFSANCFNRA